MRRGLGAELLPVRKRRIELDVHQSGQPGSVRTGDGHLPNHRLLLGYWLIDCRGEWEAVHHQRLHQEHLLWAPDQRHARRSPLWRHAVQLDLYDVLLWRRVQCGRCHGNGSFLLPARCVRIHHYHNDRIIIIVEFISQWLFILLVLPY
jgi:hypothetical protein